MTSSLPVDLCAICGRRVGAHVDARNRFVGCVGASRREGPQAFEPDARGAQAPLMKPHHLHLVSKSDVKRTR